MFIFIGNNATLIIFVSSDFAFKSFGVKENDWTDKKLE